MNDVLLRLEGITKRYGSLAANDDVALTVRRGEIHAVLGENGAGKSTLMKVIYGVTRPDAGEVLWKGAPVSMRNPAEARTLGIGMVFQHFSLFETMTVAENISMALPDSPRDLAPRIREAGARLGLPVDPDAPVHALSVGERQRVEIIRCLLQDPDLIIMDEPTAVLSPSAVPALFETLRRIAGEGRAIIFISHKLEEIRALCHTATIMRGGKVVATVDPTATTADDLARLMIGSALPHPVRPPRELSPKPALTVDDLVLPAADPFAMALDHIALKVHPGEIVGIAGVSGNGQAELVRVLSGETRLPSQEAPRVRLEESSVGDLGPRDRRRMGLAFVPEERLGRGAVPQLSLADNAYLTAAGLGLSTRGFIRFAAVKAFAESLIAGNDVRCSGPDAPARSLSGGNLQKFIVGREMALAPKVLIVSQPTWGVDVGAAAAIRQRLVDMAGKGAAILVISDELDEILETADRLHVIFRGRLSPSVPATVDRDRIGLAMAGDFAALAAVAPDRSLAHA
ncbi:ATP-binding cassette domain-containing protein [Chthonobacter albigriseus]|uniref:ATP-binding cassette domain-containing protein n=1 Tax=Chthonobacter albigriseus TaxID=1683161 RepID=UPI0015EF5A1A